MKYFLFLCLFGLFSFPALSAEVKGGREPRVEIWLPPDFQKHEGPWPLIIFSHGFGGCAIQSSFLTSYLAENGYIVAAPDHTDAACDKYGGRLAQGAAGTKGWPERPFRNPEKWDDTTEADRKDDVLFTLSSLLDDRKYAPFIDQERMGLMGHSLGGYTVLGLAGAWPSWKDIRFKAVLAFSPFITPYVSHQTLGKIAVPVMYQGGTKDVAVTPVLKKSAYAATPLPTYFIELDGAGHFAWTQLDKEYQAVIQRTSLDYFNKYLKGEDIRIEESGKKQIRTFWSKEKGP